VKPRRQSLWYWLVPGIRVKRYVLLFAAGTAIFILAAIGILQETRSSEVLRILTIMRDALAGLMPPSRAPFALLALYGVAAVGGIYVMVLASALLSHSLLAAFTGSAPREPIARTVYRYRKAASLAQVVVIGGGSGIKPVIQCLRTENVKLTTIVTMADSGGSTGRLREATGVLPPGDFRNALIAMAGDTTRSARLLAYRFPEQLEGIGGHNVGNLLIAALSDIKGGFGDAVQELSDIMQMPGRVLPMSLNNISLRAHFADGSTVDGEDQIPLQGKKVDTIEVLPSDAKPFVPALEAISRADFIIIGPGSLFTSLIPPLSIEATADTIARASATRVLVVNAMTERGETDGYTVGMHVHKVEEVLGHSCIDLVLLSNTPIPAETLSRYAAAGVQPVSNDMPRNTHPRVIEADICTTGDGLVRHDPGKLRVVLRSLLGL